MSLENKPVQYNGKMAISQFFYGASYQEASDNMMKRTEGKNVLKVTYGVEGSGYTSRYVCMALVEVQSDKKILTEDL